MRLSIFTIRDQIGGSATFSACENSTGRIPAAAVTWPRCSPFNDRDTRQTSDYGRAWKRASLLSGHDTRARKKTVDSRFKIHDALFPRQFHIETIFCDSIAVHAAPTFEPPEFSSHDRIRSTRASRRRRRRRRRRRWRRVK